MRQTPNYGNRSLIIATAIFLVAATTARGQSPATTEGPSPGDRVNELWMSATQGDLLTAEGWKKTSRFYIHEDLPPANSSFEVMSNDWAVGPIIVKGETAEVGVGYIAAGKIDSTLRYTPPPRIPYMKTGIMYRLTLVSGYNVMYGPDGKTIISQKPSGTRGWQIEDPRGMPWTTVNTAVRYVLEMREKTANPIVKKNADETLAKLLQLH
jgi:hypothetical protein